MWSNFWQLKISDRLVQWKEVRQSLSGKSYKEAINECNKLWSTAPFVNYYLSPDQPSSWPDPWTLLAENYYCDVAKALGIIYTMYFTRHKNMPVEFRVYYNLEDKSRYNLAWFDDGKYILNYWPHEIVNTELLQDKPLQLLYQYSSQDLNLERY